MRSTTPKHMMGLLLPWSLLELACDFREEVVDVQVALWKEQTVMSWCLDSLCQSKRTVIHKVLHCIPL